MPYLYHIHTPEMGLDDGYIGIANDCDVRWKQHEHCAHNLNHRYIVYQQMRNHKGNYIKTIIDEGSREYVSQREFELRPQPMMGWNMAAGGGNPIVIWKQPDRWLCNELWHPTHGEEHVSKNNTLSDIIERHYNKRGTSNELTALSIVLLGKAYQSCGWQLRDKQLARSVKTWIESPWDQTWLTNNIDKVHVTYSNRMLFMKMIGQGKNGNMNQLVKGVRKKAKGWFVITEQEFRESKANEISLGY